MSAAPSDYGSPVPWAWTELLAEHRRAQVAREAQRTATGAAWDVATADYVRAVDAVIDALDRLTADRTTGRITAFLAKKERS